VVVVTGSRSDQSESAKDAVYDETVRNVAYHPDPEISAEIAREALEAERADLAAGYPPRRWQCECGASHGRGHFQVIGVHRCLACGYVGQAGAMFGTSNPVPPRRRLAVDEEEAR
jgi:hypothetical protein